MVKRIKGYEPTHKADVFVSEPDKSLFLWDPIERCPILVEPTIDSYKHKGGYFVSSQENVRPNSFCQ